MSLLQSFQSVFSASPRSANPSWLATPPAKLPTAPTPLFGHAHDDEHGDWVDLKYKEAKKLAPDFADPIERAKAGRVSVQVRDAEEDESEPDGAIEFVADGIRKFIRFVCPACGFAGSDVDEVVAHGKGHDKH